MAVGEDQLPVLLVAPGASCPDECLAAAPARSPQLQWMGCQGRLLGRSLSPLVAAGLPLKRAVWWDMLAPPCSC